MIPLNFINHKSQVKFSFNMCIKQEIKNKKLKKKITKVIKKFIKVNNMAIIHNSIIVRAI